MHSVYGLRTLFFFAFPSVGEFLIPSSADCDLPIAGHFLKQRFGTGKFTFFPIGINLFQGCSALSDFLKTFVTTTTYTARKTGLFIYISINIHQFFCFVVRTYRIGGLLFGVVPLSGSQHRWFWTLLGNEKSPNLTNSFETIAGNEGQLNSTHIYKLNRMDFSNLKFGKQKFGNLRVPLRPVPRPRQEIRPSCEEPSLSLYIVRIDGLISWGEVGIEKGWAP